MLVIPRTIPGNDKPDKPGDDPTGDDKKENEILLPILAFVAHTQLHRAAERCSK